MYPTIQIGGKERPIHFGHWALKMIADGIRVDGKPITIDQLIDGPYLTQFDHQLRGMTVALNEGARLSGFDKIPAQIPEYQLDDRQVADWLDETPGAIEDAYVVYVSQVIERSKKKRSAVEAAMRTVAKITSQSPSPSTD